MIDESVVADVLSAALRTGADFAELFAEERRSSSAHFDDGKVEELTSGRSLGVGLRVVRGDTTGFAHTSDLSEPGLLAAAEAASAAARGGGGGVRQVALTRRDPERTPVQVLPQDVPKASKVELLARADDAARSEGDAIRQVSASYVDGRRRILVANSDGLLSSDDQVRTRFMVSCVATGDTGMQTGYEGPGGTVGFEFYDDVVVEDVARTAARRALRMLEARPAPSGTLPVVLRRAPAVSCSTRRAATGSRPTSSAGTRRCSRTRSAARWPARWSPWSTTAPTPASGAPTPSTTRATRPGATPSSRTASSPTTCGTTCGPARHGRESSGNGRRQSYQHLPMVRMTNTYVLAGEDDPDEIIRQTPYGIYCVQLGGGQVNTATGDFVFGITEAYMIENGEITDPVRSANLIGNGPEVLRAIDAVGNDFDTWAGTCGKDGQGVPVSAGQPTLRVAAMTVGGTAGG